MFNALTKTAITVLFFVLHVGCKSPEERAKEEARSRAEMLVEEIRQSVNAGKYVYALELIDSVKAIYPDEKEYVVAAMEYFPRAMEGMVLDSIPAADKRMAEVRVALDSMSAFFVSVSIPGIEGYMIDKSLAGKTFIESTNVQPRLGDELIPWTLAVNIVGRRPETTTLRLDIDGVNAATAVAQDANERRVALDNGEMISFGPEETAPIAMALQNNPGGKAVLYAVGKNGEVAIPLSNDTRRAIVRTYQLAELRNADVAARKNRELLERKLLLARDQIANTPVE